MTALPQFSLRPYDKSDRAAVCALHVHAFEHLAATHHTSAQLAAHSAMTRDAAYAADLAASHLALAVRESGAIIATAGWIAVAGEAGTARIRKVFVHPDLARRGLASHMVRDAGARAEAAGYPRLVVRANINAVPLYRKLGYETLREGEMDAGGGIALPVHFMAKT